MNSDGQDEVLDKVCRRYSLLCKDIQLNVLKRLNGLHKNVQSTYEVKTDSKIS